MSAEVSRAAHHHSKDKVPLLCLLRLVVFSLVSGKMNVSAAFWSLPGYWPHHSLDHHREQGSAHLGSTACLRQETKLWSDTGDTVKEKGLEANIVGRKGIFSHLCLSKH